MRAATEGSLRPVIPQGNLVEVLGREVRQGSPGELMVDSSASRQRRPPCKTNKEMSDEAADAAALTYLLTPRGRRGGGGGGKKRQGVRSACTRVRVGEERGREEQEKGRGRRRRSKHMEPGLEHPGKQSTRTATSGGRRPWTGRSGEAAPRDWNVRGCERRGKR